jgi:hypothetical protein
MCLIHIIIYRDFRYNAQGILLVCYKDKPENDRKGGFSCNPSCSLDIATIEYSEWFHPRKIYKSPKS